MVLPHKQQEAAGAINTGVLRELTKGNVLPMTQHAETPINTGYMVLG